MTLTIQLPPDVEAKFITEAKARGISLEQSVVDTLREVVSRVSLRPEPGHPLNLPAMKGTVIGSMHRRDIYNER